MHEVGAQESLKILEIILGICLDLRRELDKHTCHYLFERCFVDILSYINTHYFEGFENKTEHGCLTCGGNQKKKGDIRFGRILL